MRSHVVLAFLLFLSDFKIIFCSDFEESCSATSDCENYETRGLSCENGFCSCLSKVPMHYDFYEKACRINMGEKCATSNESLGRFCPSGTACILLTYFPSSALIRVSDMVIPRCRCLNGIAQLKLDNTSHCVPFQEVGQKCDNVNPCDESARVNCVNNTCQCALGKENMFFEDASHRCVSRLGKKCLPSTCNINSQCVTSSGDVCSAYDDCQMGTCKCLPGFSSTTDGKRCLRSYGQRCDSTIESRKCNHDEFLDCLNGFPNENVPAGIRRKDSLRSCVKLDPFICI